MGYPGLAEFPGHYVRRWTGRNAPVMSRDATGRKMKRVAVALALCACTAVFAMPSCISGPAISTDKALHFAGTAAISAGVSALTQNADVGFWAGILAGAAREIYKETHGMRCEYSSMAYDLAGAAAGSWAVQHWYILPKRGGFEIGYVRVF